MDDADVALIQTAMDSNSNPSMPAQSMHSKMILSGKNIFHIAAEVNPIMLF